MRYLVVVLMIAVLSGCGLIPAYRRAQPDTAKLAHMAMHGASQRTVRMDFGRPDKIETQEGGAEIWTYENREGGRTIVFEFDERGRLVVSSIL